MRLKQSVTIRGCRATVRTRTLDPLVVGAAPGFTTIATNTICFDETGKKVLFFCPAATMRRWIFGGTKLYLYGVITSWSMVSIFATARPTNIFIFF
jgi:hypothetical protein